MNLARFVRPKDIPQFLILATAILSAALYAASRLQIHWVELFVGPDYGRNDALFVLVTVLALDIYALQKTVESETKEVKDLFSIPEFKLFTTQVEQAKYITNRISAATLCVYDLTWYHQREMYRNQPIEKKLIEDYEDEICSFSISKEYREIFIFDVADDLDKQERVRRLERRRKENIPMYSCRYFNGSEIPRFKCIIIDKKEAIVCSSFGDEEIRCAVTHPELTRFFVQYFNELWSAAKIIKQGQTWDDAEYYRITQRRLN